MVSNTGEFPCKSPEMADDFSAIKAWFENKIALSNNPFDQDMYADALGLYDQFDPVDVMKKEGFELLNERIVEHGIRTGDLDIFDLAFPHTRPGKRWELLADLVVARNKSLD